MNDPLQRFVKSTYFCFPLSSGGGGTEAWTSAIVPDVVDCCVSSGVWSYCRRYDFADWVPTGCEIAGCATKASFSSFESLREAITTSSSSVVRQTVLHDLPWSLDLLDSHCSSLTICEWIRIISPNFIVSGTRPLTFYSLVIGLTMIIF